MTRKSVYALLLGVAVVAGGCQKKDAAPAASPVPGAAAMTEDEKAVYALGAAIGQQVAQQPKALALTGRVGDPDEGREGVRPPARSRSSRSGTTGPSSGARAKSRAIGAAAADKRCSLPPSATARLPKPER